MMSKNEFIIAKYLNLLYYIIHPNDEDHFDGEFIYRGQSNASWKLKSSAQRRLVNFNKTKKSDFLLYHEHLLENAKDLGYNVKSKEASPLTDLELLAEIQHNGGATCLTDFTTNFLIALWFASFEDKDNIEYKEVYPVKHDHYNNKVLESHGKVYILDIEHEKNIEKIYPIRELRQGDKIISLLEKRVQYNDLKMTLDFRFWLWKPNQINDRIKEQESVFMFGLPDFESNFKYMEIFVPKEDKEAIREELQTLFNYRQETIYKDLPGFAFEANSSSKPIGDKILSKKKCLKKIQLSVKRGEYKTAFEYTERALRCKKGIENECSIKCNNEKVNFYYERGKLCLQLNPPMYDSALTDFYKVISLCNNENSFNPLGAFRNIISILFHKAYFKDAVLYCNKAKEYCKNNNECYMEFLLDLFELSVMLKDEYLYAKAKDEIHKQEKLPVNGQMLIELFDAIHSKTKVDSSIFQLRMDEFIKSEEKFEPCLLWSFEALRKSKPIINNTENLLLTMMTENTQKELLDKHIKELNLNTVE